MRCQEGIVKIFLHRENAPFSYFLMALVKICPTIWEAPPDCLQLLTRSSTPLVQCGDQRCPLGPLLRRDNLACDNLVTISGLYYGVTISLVTIL